MNRIHALLAVQSLVAILVSLNRLGSWTMGYVLSNQFLRWVDFNNMLVLPLISIAAFYLLKKTLEYDSLIRNGQLHLALNLAFLVGVYLLAAGYGDHEVTNYLHGRFCSTDSRSDLCRIIIFNDDEFSHWIFFAGFVLVNASLLLLQRLFPHIGKITSRDVLLLNLNAFFLAAGILANLGFEEIGLDLYIVAVLAILSAILLWRRGRQPLFVYYTTAYWLGLLASVLAQFLRG